MSVADLETALANLIAARASGLRTVQYHDHRAEYKTDQEMAAAIGDLERRIAVLRGGRVAAVQISSSKGF